MEACSTGIAYMYEPQVHGELARRLNSTIQHRYGKNVLHTDAIDNLQQKVVPGFAKPHYTTSVLSVYSWGEGFGSILLEQIMFPVVVVNIDSHQQIVTL